uniref:MICOS complex subunit MIC60 n=1 Tax=Leersia perrieri TaxID=77586 RepID=A0A0D9WA35_9ORYZ
MTGPRVANFCISTLSLLYLNHSSTLTLRKLSFAQPHNAAVFLRLSTRRPPPPAGSPPLPPRSPGGDLTGRSEPRLSTPLRLRTPPSGEKSKGRRSPAMLRRCMRDLYSLRYLKRIPRPISSEVPSPACLQPRSKSTQASQQGSTQNTIPGPQGKPSQSGSNVPKVLLGTLMVGAAAMVAHQAGYIDLQFKDGIFPSNIKVQNIGKAYEDMKASSQQKVDEKQVTSDPNIDIFQNGKNKVHPPKDLPTEGMGQKEILMTGEQPISSEEKGRETLAQGTPPVPDEHKTDAKPLSQDVPAVEINTIIDDKAASEVPPEETDKTTNTVSPVPPSPATVGPPHQMDTDTDAPKDPSSVGATEHKSLAETYLLQEEPDNSKDRSAKESKHNEVTNTGTSDDGKIVLDIIEAIHAAERKQADIDAYMYSEEKRKLKEKYEKELKDTRARELMYAEEAAILDKELKREILKSAAAIKELQENAEQKLHDELHRKDEETSQQVEKVRELAKAELAAALAKEKASQIEQIAEANLNGTLALEDALSTGSPIKAEVDQLRKSLEGIDKDSLLELALSSVPEDVLEYGSDTPMELNQKFNSLKEKIRHFSLIPEGGGGILTHAVAHVASSIKALEGGLQGSEAAEIASEWVKRARKRAIAEQTLTLLHSYASSITFS